MGKKFTAALIGAGEESLHAIRIAAETGIKTLALDGNPSAPGLFEADQGICMDISDADAVVGCLKEREIDFLLPSPIGRLITVWGRVNDALGLKGISAAAAEACADKWLFHEKLFPEGLRECACRLIRQAKRGEKPEETQELMSMPEISFPAILKPRFGSGSRAVRSLENAEELQAALNEAPDEDMILEEEVPGEEYGADGAVFGGQVRLILLRKKLNTEKPFRQAIGYYSTEPGPLWEKAEALLKGIIETLRVENALFHADLILRETGEFFPIEFAPRPSGHYLHDLFTPMATGVDMIREYIRFQTGEQRFSEAAAGGITTLPPLPVKRLLLRFLSLPAGTLRYAPEAVSLELPPGILLKAARFGIKPGDALKEASDGHSLIGRGYFILETRESKVWQQALERAAEAILDEFIVVPPK